MHRARSVSQQTFGKPAACWPLGSGEAAGSTASAPSQGRRVPSAPPGRGRSLHSTLEEAEAAPHTLALNTNSVRTGVWTGQALPAQGFRGSGGPAPPEAPKLLSRRPPSVPVPRGSDDPLVLPTRSQGSLSTCCRSPCLAGPSTGGPELPESQVGRSTELLAACGDPHPGKHGAGHSAPAPGTVLSPAPCTCQGTGSEASPAGEAPEQAKTSRRGLSTYAVPRADMLRRRGQRPLTAQEGPGTSQHLPRTGSTGVCLCPHKRAVLRHHYVPPFEGLAHMCQKGWKGYPFPYRAETLEGQSPGEQQGLPSPQGRIEGPCPHSTDSNGASTRAGPAQLRGQSPA